MWCYKVKKVAVERMAFVAELGSMKNIGKEMERKLQSVGICSAEELIQIGSQEAFLRLRLQFSNVCLVHLYTLQGAIDDVSYNQLPEEVRKEWAAKIPLRRGGTPEDVANTCTFLASDLSSYVTGQTIHVCGGMNV